MKNRMMKADPTRKSMPRVKTRKGALNFEKFASEGNQIVNELVYELDTDRNTAARVLKAVLHAVRDRLMPNDAIEFAQGLPLALKGVFIDQYDLSSAPVVIRSPERFLDFVYYKAGYAPEMVFPDRQSIVNGLHAVFFVLENHMDYGQIEQIRHMINDEIMEMIDSYEEL